jgi:hypothetical protein
MLPPTRLPQRDRCLLTRSSGQRLLLPRAIGKRITRIRQQLVLAVAHDDRQRMQMQMMTTTRTKTRTMTAGRWRRVRDVTTG